MSQSGSNRIYPIVHDLLRTEENVTAVEVSVEDRGRPLAAMDELLERAFGGIVANVAFKDYLRSEEAWEDLASVVAATRQAGLTLWLYDERGYPSGKAGGLTLEGHPEFEAKGCYLARFGLAASGQPQVFETPGLVLEATVFAGTLETADLGRRLEVALDLSDNRVEVAASPEAGVLYVFFLDRAYEGTHCVVNVSDKLPYVDLMDFESTARFIELTHQAYYDRFREAFDEGVFEAMFTDEPSLMSGYLVQEEQPHAMIAWSRGLREEFYELYGYDLVDQLPLLFEGDPKLAGSVRRDFYALVTRKVRRSFFKQIRDWCRGHNIAATGHILLEEGIIHHVAFYGDGLSCLLDFDIPGCDQLCSDPRAFLGNGQIPPEKLATSAAHLQGLTQTMTETSDYQQRLAKQSVTELDIRATLGWQFAMGINTITSYYPWAAWEPDFARRLNDYTERCCQWLRHAQPLTKVALFYPIRSVWTHFVPQTRGMYDLSTQSPETLALQTSFGALTHDLIKQGVEFDYITEEALQEASLEGNALMVGNCAYQALVLPEVTYIEERTIARLQRFSELGGLVLRAGSLEAFTGKGDEPASFVNSLPLTDASKLGEALRAADLVPVLPSAPTETLVYCVRKKEGKRVYFLQNHSEAPCLDNLRLAGEGEVLVIDPVTGEENKRRAFVPEPGWVELGLELAPWHNVLVVVG